MADAVGNDNPNGPRNANSPPPTPPSPTGSEIGAKMSRKREREVSLEPVTAPISTVDGARDPRDVRVPKKKNKLQLDSTAEEDDTGSRSRSTSPAPQVGSPPQEMKIRVRQISQGVEDLSWRGMKKPDDEAATKMSVDNHIHSVAESDDDKDMDASSNEPSLVPPTDVPPTEGQSSTEPTANGPTDTNGAVHLQVEHPSGRRDSDSDSADREKGVKRKYPERGTSQGPPESETQPPEPVKRPRDDADKDANPRVTKRPSPPPETARKSPQKASGFMAYASTKSPFSAVKGPNVFASPSSSKHSVFASPSSSLTNTPICSTPSLPAIPVLKSVEPSTASLVTVLGQSPASASTSAFQTPPRSAASTPAKPVSGFGAYASTNSPFKLNRSKSPPRKTTSSATITAFSAYKGGNSFMKPAPKRVQRAGSPSPVSANESDAEEEGDATFGDKLRAVRDDSDDEGEDSKLNLTEQDVVTGEEDEQTMFSVRGKLYALNGSAWKERGVGVLKVNVNELTRRARILMRKDAVHTTLLNAPLFYGMHCTLAQDPRYLRFSVIESGESTHFNLRLSNPQAAQDLLKNIRTHMPDA